MHTLFNIRKNRWWAIFPLIVLIWHSLYISFSQSPDYLLFICYPANLLLISGIFLRHPLMIGIGFGWTLIAFPLWAYSAYLTGTCEISCLFFHCTGVLVGCLTAKQYSFPRMTWLAALIFAAVMQHLARLFTNEQLNINAAHHIYDGWQGIFSNYSIYTLAMVVGFGTFFFLLTTISNLIFHGKRPNSLK